MRRAAAASGSAHGGWRAVLLRRTRAPRTDARPALMQAPQRYPELFLAPPERTPDSFWISLIGAAIVAPRRLSFLYAALATIALLLDQAYWVLGHDAPVNSFVQPGLLAIGCFIATGITGWLASRVAANERLAMVRGRE